MTIVFISKWDTFKIHCFSFVLGLWVIFKYSFQYLWKSSKCSESLRDTPPSCVVETNLGQHSYIKLKGIKFHYVESGSKNRPLVLFLHGFPDCWFSWRHQISTLSEYFRTVAIDLKGFGDSDKPQKRKNYQIRVLVDELKQLITALGANNCILIGHDLGAHLGWYFINQYPHLVDKFVCISCPHPNVIWDELPKTSVFNSRWIYFSQLPYLPEMDALRDDVKIINECFNHLDKKSSENSYIEAYKYTFSREEDWTGPINYYRNIPYNRIVTPGEQLEIPCLFIVGNKDNFLNLESVVKSTEFVDRFTMKIIEGAGHFPHQECPEVVNKHLLAFLHKSLALQKENGKVVSKGIMDRMFGAVSSTVKYGNQIVDVVHKKTNGVVGALPSKALYSSNS